MPYPFHFPSYHSGNCSLNREIDGINYITLLQYVGKCWPIISVSPLTSILDPRLKYHYLSLDIYIIMSIFWDHISDSEYPRDSTIMRAKLFKKSIETIFYNKSNRMDVFCKTFSAEHLLSCAPQRHAKCYEDRAIAEEAASSISTAYRFLSKVLLALLESRNASTLLLEV